MSAHDRNGRAWAKISELEIGSKIVLDSGFTCIEAGPVQVERDEFGVFFLCTEGKHYIAGQADDGEHCIGIYKV